MKRSYCWSPESISLIRSHPDVPNLTVKKLIAQTLHLNDYVHLD